MWKLYMQPCCKKKLSTKDETLFWLMCPHIKRDEIGIIGHFGLLRDVWARTNYINVKN